MSEQKKVYLDSRVPHFVGEGFCNTCVNHFNGADCLCEKECGDEKKLWKREGEPEKITSGKQALEHLLDIMCAVGKGRIKEPNIEITNGCLNMVQDELNELETLRIKFSRLEAAVKELLK